MSNYLVLSHLNVKNANAVSSPLSIGVPAVTAFLGATHKLQRFLNANGYPSVRISGTGIVIHDTDLKTFAFNAKGRCETTRMSGRSLTKSGGRFSTIPDPKIDMVTSLICEVEDEGFDIYDEKDFLSKVDTALSRELRIAGGDILPPRVQGGKEAVASYVEAGRVRYFTGRDARSANDIRDIKRLLTPGYVLLDRKELLKKEMEKGEDSVVAFIDYLAVHHECTRSDDGMVEWTMKRKTAGWIVPISVGYQGISVPGKAENQRDSFYPHIFGENLITLGEFKMINTINDFDKIIWRYDVDLEKQKFACVCEGEK